MSHTAIYYAELTRDQKVQKLADTDLAQKSCRARSDGKVCVLDAHHRSLGSAHIHRDDGGALISFRAEEK
jgi:hypothetical protein